MDTVMSIIGSVGFPIAACMVMGYYVKHQTDTYREDVKDLQKSHRDEIEKLADALNNNTIVMQKLCDKLEQEESHVTTRNRKAN